MCLKEEMAFEPREVVICRDRKFSDLYSLGEEIGKLVKLLGTFSLFALLLLKGRSAVKTA